jgi:DNA-binding NarL/FixJ family response regulator
MAGSVVLRHGRDPLPRAGAGGGALPQRAVHGAAHDDRGRGCPRRHDHGRQQTGPCLQQIAHKLVAEGQSSKEIAETLVISVRTVQRHGAKLLRRLGPRDRLELTRHAIRAGLIEP